MLDLQYSNQTDLFQLALGLGSPWKVKEVVFSELHASLRIYLDHEKGAKFPCPDCQQPTGVYDTVERTWRHLNFFQYETYLHVDLPRIQCPDCKITKNVSVPWAREYSGFTLLFEAFVMELAKAMPLVVVERIVNEYDNRLMRIVEHYVTEARKRLNLRNVKVIGVDETSKAKGHDYVSVFTDAITRRVLFATEGRDFSTVQRFSKDLKEHGGDPDNIQQACADLSPAFKKGITECLPSAEIVFDRFHVMQLVSKAVDDTRKTESKDQPLLSGSRYAWLHNPETATDNQKEQVATLTKLHLKTARAYQIRLALRSVYELSGIKKAEYALKKWYFWATHSRIEPIIKAAKTIKEHWTGVIAFFNDRLANGLAEGVNSVIQTLKRRARGYANVQNFITMIYLICGKLTFNLPAVCGLTHGK